MFNERAVSISSTMSVVDNTRTCENNGSSCKRQCQDCKKWIYSLLADEPKMVPIAQILNGNDLSEQLEF